MPRGLCQKFAKRKNLKLWEIGRIHLAENLFMATSGQISSWLLLDKVDIKVYKSYKAKESSFLIKIWEYLVFIGITNKQKSKKSKNNRVNSMTWNGNVQCEIFIVNYSEQHVKTSCKHVKLFQFHHRKYKYDSMI